MGKRVAILQSNYIPWKGYFDLIASVDEFIIYDDVQFTKNDWRNRNRIKTPSGVQWISIPAGQNINRRIRDVVLASSQWRPSHWKTLQTNYRRAECYDQVAPLLESLYVGREDRHLSSINRAFIEAICGFLGIKTRITNSWDYSVTPGRLENLIGLCNQAGADTYVSGPAARAYLDVTEFARSGVSVEWFDYGGYPIYPQLWGEFVHEVSIVDVIFNCGKSARQHMKFSARGLSDAPTDCPLVAEASSNQSDLI